MRRGKHQEKETLARRLSPLTITVIAIILCMMLPIAAFADVTVDLALGNVTIGDTDVSHTTSAGAVTEAHGGAVTVTQSTASTSNSVTVNTTTVGSSVDITLSDVNTKSYVNVNAGADTTVSLELDGSNTVKAVQKSDAAGSLLINDANSDGSLTIDGEEKADLVA